MASSLARVMAAKAAAIWLLVEGGMAGGIVFGSRGISDDVLESWEVWLERVWRGGGWWEKGGR